MSNRKEIIEIAPPPHPSIGLTEPVRSYIHDCTGCGGSGYSGWDTNPDTYEQERQECTICNGSGKLEAEITINWKPSKNN